MIQRYAAFIIINHIWLFIFCNIGDEVTRTFLNINEVIYDCDWHNIPLRYKKYLPSILLIAQKPVYIEGMGSVRATRETFKTVIPSFYLIVLIEPYIFTVDFYHCYEKK